VADRGGKVTSILCVGGFGQSAYLFSRLKARFQTDLPPAYSRRRCAGLASAAVADSENRSIEIMQPANAWTSVVRGAIELGLASNIVTERKCHYHYGIKCDPTYNHGTHPIESKVWDDYDQCFRASGGMRWYIPKGEPVSTERKIKLGFSCTYTEHPLNNRVFLIITDLKCSENEVQPLMHNSNDCSSVCTITADLSGLPRSKFRSKTVKGKKMWRLFYYLVMTINSADIEFHLEIDDKVFGSVTASFDH